MHTHKHYGIFVLYSIKIRSYLEKNIYINKKHAEALCEVLIINNNKTPCCVQSHVVLTDFWLKYRVGFDFIHKELIGF